MGMTYLECEKCKADDLVEDFDISCYGKLCHDCMDIERKRISKIGTSQVDPKADPGKYLVKATLTCYIQVEAGSSEEALNNLYVEDVIAVAKACGVDKCEADVVEEREAKK